MLESQPQAVSKTAPETLNFVQWTEQMTAHTQRNAKDNYTKNNDNHGRNNDNHAQGDEDKARGASLGTDRPMEWIEGRDVDIAYLMYYQHIFVSQPQDTLDSIHQASIAAWERRTGHSLALDNKGELHRGRSWRDH